jgi:two-component system response regulator FixJ
MTEPGAVYIVDDDEGLRRSLGDLITLRTPWRVKAFVDGPSWLGSQIALPPGCALIDYSMPAMNGVLVIQQMVRAGTAHEIIMVTGEGNIAVAVQAMRSGATDFIEKPVRFEHLEQSITAAMERLLDTAEARMHAIAAKERLARLKPRELDVMMGLIEGWPNKIIAYKLGLSIRTVELYRSGLMDQLGVESVAEILKLAFAAKLIAA